MLSICEFWQLSIVWRTNESKKPDESYKYLLLYIEDKIEGDIWDTYTDTSSIRISDRWWIVWQVSDIWHVCDTFHLSLIDWVGELVEIATYLWLEPMFDLITIRIILSK